MAYGDSFEKDYYYSDVASSPLNQNNILHLEYIPFKSSVAKSYLNKNLEFDFIKKPTSLDALKYLMKNLKSILTNVTKHNKHKHLSFMSTLLFYYIELLDYFAYMNSAVFFYAICLK